MIVNASCIVTKMLNELNSLKTEKNIEIPDNIMSLGTDALGLLGHCNKVINT